jgi:ATP-dependent DNA helicase RecG
MVLSALKGVGPVTLKKLEKLGINDVDTLLYHFPSRYVDRRKRLKVFDLKLLENENYHCVATIKDIKKIRLRTRREMTMATFEDDTGYIGVTWFNNPYIIVQYNPGDTVVFSGPFHKGRVSNPKIKHVITEDDVASFAKVEAVYPETRGLRSYQIHQFVQETLGYSTIAETLPEIILKNENLVGRGEALQAIHFPNDSEDLRKARERLGFEEIYRILVEAQKRKSKLKTYDAHPIRVNPTAHELLLEQLPFILTESQQKAIDEIFTDLGTPKPMHRLLNGDVGSGKTIVAAAAAWQVVNNGMQVVILAPTGVLANQHYLTFNKLFSQYNIPIHLATSDTRKDVDMLTKALEDAKDFNHIFIGTHALFHRLDMFKRVGLLVIDEQHKFGVKQREMLANEPIVNDDTQAEALPKMKRKMPLDNPKTEQTVPHVLSMSATPIPRSLALTLFGDIEVSFLEAKPEGRKKIVTKVINDADLQYRMYEWIREEVAENKAQAYVVCPLIQDSEKSDVKSAMQEFERLQKLFPEFTIELLHGKIKQKQKDEILLRFKNGETHVLVSTSVIEVGIDNPNATIMVIEGAERFGLAQLHQIRGRVGRSDKQSYCFLKTTDGSSSDRLDFFAETSDGFKVAEFDLQQRGPGEVYGEVQSGIPDLKIANILDIELIKRVRKYVG